MAHWAELDGNNSVVRVIVCDPDDGADGAIHPPKFCTDVLGGTWIRTYYATAGKTYAGIGHTWDGANFQPPAPADTIADAVQTLVDAKVLTDAQVQDIAARTTDPAIDAIAADSASTSADTTAQPG